MSEPHLFRSLRLRQLELRNRIVVSPMCMYSAHDGLPSEWHAVHLGSLALSGAGLVILEASGVGAIGRITPGCLGLWSDEHAVALRQLVEGMRRLAPVAVGIQLAHAGRKASCALQWQGARQLAVGDGGWETVAPSAIPHNPGDRPPHALTGDEIEGVVADFAAAARRAEAAGFDTVEIHAAHGYLLHEFLSPVANHRTDEYGGSLENRMRLLLRVAAAVREAFPPSLPVGTRISATDWVQGGWTLDESVVLSRELRAVGLDWVDCSSGGVSVAQEMTVGPGYQVPFAERVRREAGIATMAVGLITDPVEAEAIVAEGRADLVALARGVLWDPRWGWHAAAALGVTSIAPPQYVRAHASLQQAD